MNQLPILSGNTDSKPAAASSAGAGAKGDARSDGTTFGTMLAQQLDEKNTTGDKLQVLKENGLLAASGLHAALSQRGEFVQKPDETDGATLAPGDQRTPPNGTELLATLPVPLSIAEVRAQTNAGAGHDARPDIGATQKTPLRAAVNERSKLHLKPDADPLPRKEAAASGTSTLPAAAVALGADSRIAASQLAGNQEAAAPATLLATPASLTPPTATTHSAAFSSAVSTPFSHPLWTNDFSQKITWLTSHKLQQAELHLNPPQLGPIDVSLKLDGDQATLQFLSPHAAVREAIEQSIPKLREMFADNGIMLGGTTVSDQSRHQQHSESGNPSPAGFDIRPAETVGTAATPQTARGRPHDGMVDTFA